MFFYGYSYLDIPFIIGERDEKIICIAFHKSDIPTTFIEKETKGIQRASLEIKEYIDGKRKIFDFPMDISGGTIFQQKVWKAVLDIPYGETRSYKEIAEIINHPKAYRAVGLANNRNPVALAVP